MLINVHIKSAGWSGEHTDRVIVIILVLYYTKTFVNFIYMLSIIFSGVGSGMAPGASAPPPCWTVATIMNVYRARHNVSTTWLTINSFPEKILSAL